MGPGDLQRGHDPRQRAAELVGGIRAEPALSVDRRSEPLDRAVEALAEGLQLVARARHGDSTVEVLAGDVVELAAHLLDWAQRASDCEAGGERCEKPEHDGRPEHPAEARAEVLGEALAGASHEDRGAGSLLAAADRRHHPGLGPDSYLVDGDVEGPDGA